MSRVRTLLVGACLTAPSCALQTRDSATAVPQRPHFSADIRSVEEGSAQVEAGVTLDPGDLFDTPVRASYGLTERTQLSIAGSPWVYVARPGADGSGIGDLRLGFKHRVRDAEGAAPGYAFQVETKLPSARRSEGVGSGELDFFARGIASRQIAAWFCSANYELGILGDADGEGAELGHTLSLLARRPIDARWDAFGEVLARVRPESDHEGAQLRAGVFWRPRAMTTVDAGFAAGIGDEPGFRVFVGMTVNLGAQRAKQR